jgi:endonuclease YncB( thermonuclease family)
MRNLIIHITVAVLTIGSAAATTLTGHVIRVKDGDSFIMRSGGLTYEVRMYGIDAPELKQPYGKQSAKALRSYIHNKNIKIIKSGSDHYGRLVGKVYINKTYINLKMVKQGHAHWYRKYAPKDKNLKEAEQSARKSKRGLWSHPKPELPFKWRKAKTAATACNNTLQPDGTD